MPISDDALATILLTQHLFDAGVAPLTPTAFWKLLDTVAAPGELLGLSAHDVAQVAGTSAEEGDRVACLLGAATGVALHLDWFNQSGIQTITACDGPLSALKARLRTSTPPLLHVAGELGLLTMPSVGIVGSRNVTEPGREVTARVAAAAAEAGLPVVSGGARGVDQVAMKAVVDRRGKALGVLADSLTRQLRDAETRRLVTDGEVTLCTPYSPDAPFSVGNAMGRNKLIYAFARATLVVATDVETGGTWAGAREALSKNYGRVMVWRGPGEGPGNDALNGLGATAITTPEDFIRLATGDEEVVGAAQAEQLGFGL